VFILKNESANSAHYSILFTDKKEQDLYGGWTELVFVEEKYNGAYLLGFDYYEELCDFGLAPQNESSNNCPKIILRYFQSVF
jgi:hypothetical protein